MSRDESQRTMVMMIPPLLIVNCRGGTPPPISRNRPGSTDRKCHDWKSFGEGCCSKSGSVPRRGAAVLRKAMQAKHTPLPRDTQGMSDALTFRSALAITSSLNAMTSAFVRERALGLPEVPALTRRDRNGNASPDPVSVQGVSLRVVRGERKRQRDRKMH